MKTKLTNISNRIYAQHLKLNKMSPSVNQTTQTAETQGYGVN